jgi:hypothetical protein
MDPALQAALEAAANAGAAGAIAAQALAAPIPLAAHVPHFALAPAAAGQDIFLDYEQKYGLAVYKSGTAAFNDASTRADLTRTGLGPLLTAVHRRAINHRWTRGAGGTGILDISDPNDATVPTQYLLDNYGTLTAAQVAANATRYTGTDTRRAQDSAMLFESVSASLSIDAKTIMELHRTDYTVNGFPEGVMFLKKVIDTGIVTSIASAVVIRQEFSQERMKESIAELHYWVPSFQDKLKANVVELARHGQSFPETDLITNLFATYMTCPSKPFVSYIEKYEAQYLEGQPQTSSNLMSLADARVRNLHLLKKYATVDEEGEALKAMLAMQKEQAVVMAAIVADQAIVAQAAVAPPTSLLSPRQRREVEKKKAFVKKMRAQPPPANGLAQSKIMDKELIHFCSKHGKWGGHLESDCRNDRPGARGAPSVPLTAAQKEEKKKAHLRLTQALAAVMETHELEGSDDEDDSDHI